MAWIQINKCTHSHTHTHTHPFGNITSCERCAPSHREQLPVLSQRVNDVIKVFFSLRSSFPSLHAFNFIPFLLHYILLSFPASFGQSLHHSFLRFICVLFLIPMSFISPQQLLVTLYVLLFPSFPPLHFLYPPTLPFIYYILLPSPSFPISTFLTSSFPSLWPVLLGET